MKKLICLFGLFSVCMLTFSQTIEPYFTGNFNSNFEWNLMEKNQASSKFKDPLYSINTLNLNIGIKNSKNIRAEIGLGGSLIKNQVKAFGLNTTHYFFSPSIKLGYSDTLFSKILYYIAPTFSYIQGKGEILSNGFESENFTQGMSYGVEVSLNMRIYKLIGIQPVLTTRYEIFKHYKETVGSGTQVEKTFLKLYPAINLTYNF